jgi:hypothetical protein
MVARILPSLLEKEFIFIFIGTFNLLTLNTLLLQLIL